MMTIQKFFYFENNSLKFQQDFNFGANIIIKDIAKITSLNIETVKNILEKIELSDKVIENDLIDKKFFINNSYRKIKKNLVYEIVLARVQELTNFMIFKNINFVYHKEISKVIFFELSSKLQSISLEEIFQKTLSINKANDVRPSSYPDEQMLSNANKLVHFGWKKEAIPVSQPKKSIIARVFEAIFG